MALADVAATPAPAIDARACNDAIPRDYNFAAEVIARNLAAGRAQKPAYIDPRGSWTYGQLAERVDRFGSLLRALGVRREERILLGLCPRCGVDVRAGPTRCPSCGKRSPLIVPQRVAA